MKDNDLDFDGAWGVLNNLLSYEGHIKKLDESNPLKQSLILLFEHDKTYQFALALAKEMHAGTATNEMRSKGYEMRTRSKVEDIYKAMTQELIKKVKGDLNG